MATTLKVIEILSAERTAIPGLPNGINAALVWERIEAWVGWRWGERPVTFTVEGPGDWRPTLRPATITLAEIWRDDAWEAVTLRPTPLDGLLLPERAHYRIEATVGDIGDLPKAVLEAARRLGAYFGNSRQYADKLGFLTKESSDEVDSFEYASPAAAARAMQYSGAADLLRPWRIVGAA